MKQRDVGWLAAFGIGCLPYPAVEDSGPPAAEPRSDTALICTAPVDDAQVRVASSIPAASVLSGSVRLSQAFPNWSAECSDCVQAFCGQEVTRCATEPGCTEFSTCRWARENAPSPASEMLCTRDYDQSVEAPSSALRELNNCWQVSCVNACQLGRRWECSLNYTSPPPESDASVTVRQVLQWLGSDEPVTGAKVRFCDGLTPPSECASFEDAEAVTDCGGVARVELAIATDDRPGWSGYRQVTLESSTVRLQSNLSVPLSRYALQHVPNQLQMQGLTVLFGGSLELGNVVFQIFDCAHTGAEGAILEVVREGAQAGAAPVGTVRYLRGQSQGARLEDGATSAESDGGGAILNLPTDEWLRVSARVEATNTVIAQTRIRTYPGELLLLEIHPDPSLR
ncbi:MAG: hypothetical protein ABI895_34055 [Deltaproteobacteria bacterium]